MFTDRTQSPLVRENLEVKKSPEKFKAKSVDWKNRTLSHEKSHVTHLFLESFKGCFLHIYLFLKSANFDIIFGPFSVVAIFPVDYLLLIFLWRRICISCRISMMKIFQMIRSLTSILWQRKASISFVTRFSFFSSISRFVSVWRSSSSAILQRAMFCSHLAFSQAET